MSMDDLLSKLGQKIDEKVSLGDSDSAIGDIMSSSKEDYFEEMKEQQAQQIKQRKLEEQQKKDAALRSSLGPNQILFTDVTGGVLPTSGINHVITVHPDTDWTADELERIEPKDEDFVWQPDVLELLCIAKKKGMRILLVGDPGTGKTSSCGQFAHIVNQPYYQFNGKENAEGSSLLGAMGADSGSTVWKDGAITEACKVGGAMCVDEVMKLPAGVQMSMQTLYQRDGFLVLDDKQGTYKDKLVKPKESFFMMLTDNVCGQGENMDKYGASNVQDTSTLDRVDLVVHVDYMEASEEIALLKKKYPAVKDQAVLVRFASLVRTAFRKSEVSLTLSLRGLKAMCELIEEGFSVQRAIETVYINALGEEDERQAAESFLQTVR